MVAILVAVRFWALRSTRGLRSANGHKVGHDPPKTLRVTVSATSMRPKQRNLQDIFSHRQDRQLLFDPFSFFDPPPVSCEMGGLRPPNPRPLEAVHVYLAEQHAAFCCAERTEHPIIMCFQGGCAPRFCKRVHPTRSSMDGSSNRDVLSGVSPLPQRLIASLKPCALALRSSLWAISIFCN